MGKLIDTDVLEEFLRSHACCVGTDDVLLTVVEDRWRRLLDYIPAAEETERCDEAVAVHKKDKRAEVQKKIANAKENMIGYKFRHFKGKVYIVKDIAIHSETAEPMVIYTRFDEPLDIWCRPLDMFCSEVDHEKYPEVTQKFRFERMVE